MPLTIFTSRLGLLCSLCVKHLCKFVQFVSLFCFQHISASAFMFCSISAFYFLNFCFFPSYPPFDVRRSMLDVRCWMFDVGCWMLDVRCWMLDVRRSMFDVGCSIFPPRPLSCGQWSCRPRSSIFHLHSHLHWMFSVRCSMFGVSRSPQSSPSSFRSSLLAPRFISDFRMSAFQCFSFLCSLCSFAAIPISQFLLSVFCFSIFHLRPSYFPSTISYQLSTTFALPAPCAFRFFAPLR